MRFVLLRILPVVLLSAYRAISLMLYTWSWRLLIPARVRPGFGRLLRLRWIGESVNWLVPFVQVGGDVVRARLLAAQAGRAPAAAAMVADLGVGIGTQAIFCVAGLAALAAVHDVPHLARSIVIALVVAAVVGLALFAFLNRGTSRLFRLGRIRFLGRLGQRWRGMAGGAAALDTAMGELGRHPGNLALSAVWHLLGWLSHVGEMWLALWLVGEPSSWAVALAIESVSSAARALAFFLPGGIGVQEGAIAYLCRDLGIPVEAALLVALLKRLREIVVGALGLASWATIERASLGRLVSRLRTRRPGDIADA